MGNNLKLSIIIPTYNRPQMLRRALRSICTSNKNAIEVIVCDDKSPNDVAELNRKIIDEVSKEIGVEIKYIENSRKKGVSGARNYAVEHSVGEWLLFLDDDDEFVEGYIDYILTFVLNNPESDFFWSDIYIRQRMIKDNLIKKRFFINSMNELYNEVITIGISYGVCLRKSCFINCNGFNEDFLVGEDTELILNLVTQGYKFQHISQFGIIKNENSETMLSQDFSKYAKNHVVKKLLKQYFSFFEKDISTYCAFIKRGSYIYKKQNMFITNLFFSVEFILKHNHKITVFKELVWKK